MKKNFLNTLSITVFCLAIAFSSCNSKPEQTNTTQTDTAKYNTTIAGKAVSLYTLTNKNGLSVSITNLGGRVVSFMVPDKDGKLTDVVLGYDSVGTYLKKGEPFFCALIGRYGNRIGKGKFTLEGK